VDLYLNFNLFHKGLILSAIILPPARGVFGRNKFIGFSFEARNATRKVTSKTKIIIMTEAIMPKTGKGSAVSGSLNSSFIARNSTGEITNVPKTSPITAPKTAPNKENKMYFEIIRPRPKPKVI
jgi:hypothetical protein